MLTDNSRLAVVRKLDSPVVGWIAPRWSRSVYRRFRPAIECSGRMTHLLGSCQSEHHLPHNARIREVPGAALSRSRVVGSFARITRNPERGPRWTQVRSKKLQPDADPKLDRPQPKSFSHFWQRHYSNAYACPWQARRIALRPQRPPAQKPFRLAAEEAKAHARQSESAAAYDTME